MSNLVLNKIIFDNRKLPWFDRKIKKMIKYKNQIYKNTPIITERCHCKFSIWKFNKNTLTGPANCKKTTTHHAHFSLRGKSRKTNDAKSRNLNLGDFLTISRSNISKLEIFLKNRFHSNWRSCLVLTSGQKPKKSFEPFLRKISKCLILGQFADLFANISKLRTFFKNLSFFYLYSPLTSW